MAKNLRKTSCPKVSVCIPVYNAEMFISECIDSLLRQTMKDIEIVCVDDGSTDNSPAILDEYAKKHKNVKVIHQKNQGLGGARNTGIDNSNGEYVGFVDADDYVEPQMFESLYSLAKKNNCEIAMCNLVFEPNVPTKKHLWYKPYEGKITGEFLDRNIQPWNKIVSSDLLKRLSFRFFKKNGDDMYISLMMQSKGIVSTDEKFYHYRIGHDTMSNTFKVESFLNFIDCVNKQIEDAKKNGDYDTYKEYFDYRMIYVLIQTLSVAALKHDRKVFKNSKKQLKEYHYKKNKYVKSLLKNEFSRIEYYGMVNVLPINYFASSVMMNVKLKGWR